MVFQTAGSALLNQTGESQKLSRTLRQSVTSRWNIHDCQLVSVQNMNTMRCIDLLLANQIAYIFCANGKCLYSLSTARTDYIFHFFEQDRGHIILSGWRT